MAEWTSGHSALRASNSVRLCDSVRSLFTIFLVIFRESEKILCSWVHEVSFMCSWQLFLFWGQVARNWVSDFFFIFYHLIWVSWNKGHILNNNNNHKNNLVCVAPYICVCIFVHSWAEAAAVQHERYECSLSHRSEWRPAFGSLWWLVWRLSSLCDCVPS